MSSTTPPWEQQTPSILSNYQHYSPSDLSPTTSLQRITPNFFGNHATFSLAPLATQPSRSVPAPPAPERQWLCIRQGAALQKTKLMGRWKSDTFLEYLCPELMTAFSHISNKMTTNFLTLSVTGEPAAIQRPTHPNCWMRCNLVFFLPLMATTNPTTSCTLWTWEPGPHCSRIGQRLRPSSGSRGGVGADIFSSHQPRTVLPFLALSFCYCLLLRF
jgi:hypothetical protein